MMPNELPREENMDLIPEEDEEPVSEEGTSIGESSSI